MQSSTQVPLWVPIVVGVIGSIGIISGQLVSAWREGRRWKHEREREREREEMRWERERQIEELRQRKEDVLHWRELKLSTYGKFAASIQEFYNGFISLANVDEKYEKRDASIAIDIQFRDLNAAAEEVLYMCFPPIEDYITNNLTPVLLELLTFRDEIVYPKPKSPESDEANTNIYRIRMDKLQILRESLVRSREIFRNLSRDELQLDRRARPTPSEAI